MTITSEAITSRQWQVIRHHTLDANHHSPTNKSFSWIWMMRAQSNRDVKLLKAERLKWYKLILHTEKKIVVYTTMTLLPLYIRKMFDSICIHVKWYALKRFCYEIRINQVKWLSDRFVEHVLWNAQILLLIAKKSYRRENEQVNVWGYGEHIWNAHMHIDAKFVWYMLHEICTRQKAIRIIIASIFIVFG